MLVTAATTLPGLTAVELNLPAPAAPRPGWPRVASPQQPEGLDQDDRHGRSPAIIAAVPERERTSSD
jgi:hypothetical protein